MSANVAKPPKADSGITALCNSVTEAADAIQCTTSMVRDLLRLAIGEVGSIPDTRAGAAIRAAERYLGDIEKAAEELDAAQQVARIGGAV